MHDRHRNFHKLYEKPINCVQSNNIANGSISLDHINCSSLPKPIVHDFQAAMATPFSGLNKDTKFKLMF